MIHLTSAERQVLDANIMARLRTVVSPATYPRPLGVDGPHVGDIGTVAPALDLSHEATPASEDVRNLMTIAMPLQDSFIREAVMRLAKSALAKLEAGQ